MRPFVRLQAPDGTAHDLVPGDLIGRMPHVALSLDDGRISEAHAMVSLRGGSLMLLALRGRFSLGSEPLTELVLEEGQRVLLAHDLAVRVTRVVLPDEVLALQGDGLPRQVLTGACSLVCDPEPALVRGARRDAAAWLWPREDAWRVQVRGAEARDLVPGEALTVAGRRVEAVSVPRVRAGRDETELSGRVDAPLHLVAQFDSVRFLRDGAPVLAFGGLSARILSELVAFGGPVRWEVLAGEVWPHETDPGRQRHKLDVALMRLRKRLAAGGVRPGLVASTGSGHLELALGPSDTVEDQT